MTRRTNSSSAIVALAAALCGVAAGVAAAIDTHSAAPIDITANELEVVNSKCVATWRGAAEALQGKTRLRADTMRVFSVAKGVGANGQPTCGGTDRIEAEGHVFYVTPEQRARGDRAVYLARADEITITGDVIVVQGSNVARADRMIIKVSTREARLESTVTGAGKTGRVRGVFYPDKSNSAATPAHP